MVSSIAGSLLGAASTKWFKDTRAGVWCYNRFDDIADWATERYGIDILDKENLAWKTKYPNIAKRMDELEERLSRLEEKQNADTSTLL